MGNPFDALHQIKCFQCRARAFVESASYIRVRAKHCTAQLLAETYELIQQSIDKDPAFKFYVRTTRNPWKVCPEHPDAVLPVAGL